MSSEWDKKRTRDEHYSHAPNYLRNDDFEEKACKEQKEADEATVTATIHRLCKPMKVGVEKGTEDDGKQVNEYDYQNLKQVGSTEPADHDGHTHTMMVDMFGNGDTSHDAGHYHAIRSSRVGAYSNRDTGVTHSHEAEIDMSVFTTHYPSPENAGVE